MSKDFVFGIHPVMEAISSGKEIDKILVQKNLQGEPLLNVLKEANRLRIPVQKVPIEKLNRVTRKNHQGIICFISPINFASLDQVVSNAFSSGKDPLILILDRISDVRNFGAIIRTAECAGVHGVLIPEKGSAALSADAMKTSAGALNYIPVCRTRNLQSGVNFLKESGLTLIGMTEKTENSLYKTPLNGPLGIVMGSEEDGISPEMLRVCDHLASIPMTGKIGSLNVSVSTAVVIYESLRQRLSE